MFRFVCIIQWSCKIHLYLLVLICSRIIVVRRFDSTLCIIFVTRAQLEMSVSSSQNIEVCARRWKRIIGISSKLKVVQFVVLMSVLTKRKIMLPAILLRSIAICSHLKFSNAKYS